MKGEESTTDLNRQLEAYDAVAKSPESRARSRWGKWPIYAAATGAALAGASAASADIIYSGPIDISVQGFGYGVASANFVPDRGVAPVFHSHYVSARVSFPVYFHFDTSTRGSHRYPANNLRHEFARLEVNFGFSPPGGGIFRTSLGPFNSGSQRFTQIPFAKSFAPGAPIEGLTAPSARLATHGHFDTSGGHGVIKRTAISGYYLPEKGSAAQKYPWKGGYAGFQMTTSKGAREEGWIRLSFESGVPGSLEITGWAYNTDGPIDAGETGAVPEPGTLALMLLAGGAAGVLAWKRRQATHA
jgi:hypothetical protein